MGLLHNFETLKVWQQRTEALPSQETTWRKQGGNRYNMHWQRFHLDVRKTFFAVRTIGYCDHLFRDTVESPSLLIFMMQLDRILDNFIYAPFSHKWLDLMIFQGLFQPGWFYDSKTCLLWRCANPIPGGFQTPAGQRPEQPGLTSELTLLEQEIGLKTSWSTFQPELTCDTTVL